VIKRSLVILIWLCLSPLIAYPEVKGIENSCVNCHRDLSKSTFVGSKYVAWENSIHAKEGVTCNRCHGGNPSAEEIALAHTGVFNSSNPRSRVYYKHVPDMCGACHRRDFNAFKESTHYAFLEKTGGGPTCVTCHDSHATRLITPQQILLTCDECHNKRTGINPEVPAQAQAQLLLINETSLLVRCARERVPGSNREKLQAWKDISATMQSARDEWHSFNFIQVRIRILEAYDKLKAFLGQEK
jgi:hypothetical protein